MTKKIETDSPAERAAWAIYRDRSADTDQAKASLRLATEAGMDGRTREARRLKSIVEQLKVRQGKVAAAIGNIIRRYYGLK
jgi:hypothetical protein